MPPSPVGEGWEGGLKRFKGLMNLEKKGYLGGKKSNYYL
jgi:hypothetical protein